MRKKHSVPPGFQRFANFSLIFLFLLSAFGLRAQDTQIRGFVDFTSSYKGDTALRNSKLGFSFGEQDLFITSEISDRVSFLGETVFKYSATSPTRFDISVERIVIKYNYFGNHNILLGKHHTPVNYWNDTYHHGRVFFPTIFRPLMFAVAFVPLHTTGIRLQGQNLGRYRFGYELLAGNGIGSNDFTLFNKSKSVTAAINIRPVDNLRIGVSYYYDQIPAGSILNHSGKLLTRRVKQQLFSGSVAYFGKRFEFLGETTFSNNQNDSTGRAPSNGTYVYTGYRIFKKFVPYVKADVLDFSQGDIFNGAHGQRSYLVGLRYEINYLAVVKLEFERSETHTIMTNGLNFQFAVGF